MSSLSEKTMSNIFILDFWNQHFFFSFGDPWPLHSIPYFVSSFRNEEPVFISCHYWLQEWRIAVTCKWNCCMHPVLAAFVPGWAREEQTWDRSPLALSHLSKAVRLFHSVYIPSFVVICEQSFADSALSDHTLCPHFQMTLRLWASKSSEKWLGSP